MKSKASTKPKKERNLKLEGMSIKLRLILTIVPIVAVMLIVITAATSLVSRSIIVERSNNEMAATLGEYSNYVAGEMDEVKAQADTLARFVAATYKSTTIDELGDAITAIVTNSDMVLGSGLWFEPNVYDSSEQYFGPYWCKNTDSEGKWDGGPLSLMWDYSNADYDYFSQEYYLNAKKITSATITDPYYDETTGLVMASCSAPITTSDGTFIGCVTVDLMLSSVNEELSAVRVGSSGTLWLIDTSNNYVYHPAFADAAKDGMNLDDSTEMGSYVNQIKNSGIGNGSFQWSGETRLLYWDTVDGMGWKMGLTMKESEIFQKLTTMTIISIIICLVAIILTSAIIIYQAMGIANAVAVVANSLAHLREGEFVKISGVKKRTDEIGLMTDATNDVIEKLQDIVANIKESASAVGTSSEELSDMAGQISQTAEDVANAVQEIATGATQQADEIQSASENVGYIGDAVTDVQTSTGDLSSITDKMKEASEVSSNSLASLKDSSAEMTEKIDDIARTIQATQDAVSSINDKVEGITSIATQTNLLSLNASIEAARAGEAGKGFAVVADEIGKLADDSKQMADEIRKEMDVLLEQAKSAVEAADSVKQGNMDQQVALGETLEAVNGMLSDIGSTVGGVELISKGAETCESSKNKVVDVMSALSAISEENAASSEETGASMQELSATVTTLAGSAKDLKDIAEKLNKEMEFFKS